MAFDYSASFGGINTALANIGKQNDTRWLREAQADVGQSLQNGDYAAAAQKAFTYGDSATGLGLLQLGQKRDQQNLVNSTLQSWGQPQALGQIGQPQGYFATTAGAESANDPNAKNPKSSATGLYQFTTGTWNDLAAKNPQLGLTPDGRTDPDQQQRAMKVFTAQNAQILQSQGIPANDGNLYMTHFLGAQGGPAFIKGVQSNPNAPAASYVDPKSVAANRTVFFKSDGTPRTAGEVYTAMTRRFGDGSTAIAQMQGGRDQPVQMAQAAPQPGALQSDAPAAGANEAQFYIPGTNTPVASVPSIANDKNVQLWQQRLTSPAAVQNEGVRAVAQRNLDIAIKDAEQRYNAGKAPEAVREWQWAKQNGLTEAKTPVAYAAELTAAKRDPDQDVSNLRKEVHQLPSYKNLAQAAPIYRSMAETAGRNSKASDLNLVYGLGKIMDPTSVVREGEMIMVKNSAGMSEQLLGAINALNGGSALTPETRQALMKEAYSRMDTYKQQFDQDMQQYRGIVSRRGYNADDVIPNTGDFKPWEPAPKAAKPAPAPPEPPAPPNDPNYIQQNQRPDGSSPPLPSPPRPPQAPQAPVRVQSPQEALKLPSGTIFIDPNGVQRQVP